MEPFAKLHVAVEPTAAAVHGVAPPPVKNAVEVYWMSCALAGIANAKDAATAAAVSLPAMFMEALVGLEA